MTNYKRCSSCSLPKYTKEVKLLELMSLLQLTQIMEMVHYIGTVYGGSFTEHSMLHGIDGQLSVLGEATP